MINNYLTLFCILIFPFTSLANPVEDNYPDLQFNAYGTGNTCGEVLNLEVYNPTTEAVEVELGEFLVPSKGNNQAVVINGTYNFIVPPLSDYTTSLTGYCTDPERHALLNGEPTAPFSEWIHITESAPTPGADVKVYTIPGYTAFTSTEETVLTYPGTTVEFNYQIDFNRYPTSVTSTFVEVLNRLETSFTETYETDQQVIPYLSVEEQQYVIVQHAFWYYTTTLRGESYTQADLTQQIIVGVEMETNQPAVNFSESTEVTITEDATNLWDAMNLVAKNAGIITTRGEDTDWTAFYNDFIQNELNDYDPNAEDALFELIRIADTLFTISKYLDQEVEATVIEQLKELAEGLVQDLIKAVQQEGGLELDEWAALESIRHSSLYDYLSPEIKEAIDQALKERFNEHLSQIVTELPPDDLSKWVELEEWTKVDWHICRCNHERRSRT